MNVMTGFYDNSSPSISSNCLDISTSFMDPMSMDSMLSMDLNAQNHTMVMVGARESKLLEQSANQIKCDLEITLEPILSTKKLPKLPQKSETIKKIEIECSISNDSDHEIEIDTDPSLYETESDELSDYVISTVSEESFNIENVELLVISESDEDNQCPHSGKNKLVYNNIYQLS